MLHEVADLHHAGLVDELGESEDIGAAGDRHVGSGVEGIVEEQAQAGLDRGERGVGVEAELVAIVVDVALGEHQPQHPGRRESERAHAERHEVGGAPLPCGGRSRSSGHPIVLLGPHRQQPRVS